MATIKIHRFPPREELSQIAGKAKTLADLDGVLKELRALHERASGGFEPINATISALLPLEKTYRDFQAGLPTSLYFESTPSDQSVVDTAPLRAQLLMLMLPRYLALLPEIKSQPGEAVEPFLDRVISLARECGDVPLLMRAREAKRGLARGTYVWNNAGVAAFISAQNQEAAGQYLFAVISYENALNSGTDDISPKLVGKRLAALKAAHPQEYGQAMEQLLRSSAGTSWRTSSPPHEERSPNLAVPGATMTPPASQNSSSAAASARDAALISYCSSSSFAFTDASISW